MSIEAEWDPRELAARARSAARAIFATRALSLLAAAVSVTVLPRLIGPADFGVWAVAALALAVMTFIREVGLPWSVVQARELAKEQRDAYFWTSVAGSQACAAALALAAPWIAAFYAMPLLTPVIWAGCISLAVAGFGAVHTALLRRELQFVKLAVIEGGGILCGLIAALVCAYAWRDVWAFVVGHIASALWIAATAFVFYRWIPGLPRCSAQGIDVSFSFHVMLHNLLTYVGNHVGLAAGFRFGAADLGYYSRAQQLCVLMMSAFLTPITEAAFALLCRLKADEPYRNAYLSMARRAWVVFIPYAAVLPVVSADVVRTFLGAPWAPAAPILSWLAPAVVGQVMLALMAQLLLSQGRGAELRTCAAASLGVRALGAIIGGQFGLVGLAAGFAIASVAVALPLAWIACRRGPVRLRHQLAPTLPGAAIALAAVAVALAAGAAADALGLATGVRRLALVGGSAALAWAILCLAVPRLRHALLGRKDGVI